MTIVLYEPQIPQNTGNIGRLCMATQSKLVLVGRLGFSLDEHAVRRAGLDYWKEVDVARVKTLQEALHGMDPQATFLVSSKGKHIYSDVNYPKASHLIFGGEVTGVPDSVFETYRDRSVRIPTTRVRNLNLANAVAIVLYEALRQNGYCFF